MTLLKRFIQKGVVQAIESVGDRLKFGLPFTKEEVLQVSINEDLNDLIE